MKSIKQHSWSAVVSLLSCPPTPEKKKQNSSISSSFFLFVCSASPLTSTKCSWSSEKRNWRRTPRRLPRLRLRLKRHKARRDKTFTRYRGSLLTPSGHVSCYTALHGKPAQHLFHVVRVLVHFLTSLVKTIRCTSRTTFFLFICFCLGFFFFYHFWAFLHRTTASASEAFNVNCDVIMTHS